MFEGVQDQFHQFLASNSSSSSPHPNPIPLAPPPQPQSPTPLSFSLLHGCASSSSSSPSNSFPSVIFHHDPYNPVQAHLHHQQILHHQHQHQHQLQLQWASPPAPHPKQHLEGGGGGAIKQERDNSSSSTHHGFLSLERQRERSMAEAHGRTEDLIDPDSAPWSHDELLALLKIRSALENWFPEFTWEHVSRKLSELGFKRSPQKCKEKFEEESRSYVFQTNKSNTNDDVTGMENDVAKNYRLFSELEELCHHGHDPPPPPDHHQHHHHLPQQPTAMISPHHEDVNENQADANVDKQNPQTEVQEQGEIVHDHEHELGHEEIVHDKMGQLERSLDDENDGSEATDKMEEHQTMEAQENKKPRRTRDQSMSNEKKFDVFKSFCEEIVEKMMSQQEELHNKILQDMIKRDEEKLAREEAWRNQEMERFNKEMEARAKDLAVVSERQAKIIEFLKKISSDSSTNTMIIPHKNDTSNEAPKSTHQNPSSSATHSSPNHLPTSSNEGSISHTSNANPNVAVARKPRPNKRPRKDSCSDGNDIGKRWPREEVLALINIRCNVDVTNKTGPDDSGQNNKSNSNNKNPPLWERISHKMMEKGYSRSAKRCKEKWENINKYFRKTKDMNKNRSVDSRTCPYFHQLSHLYNQGRVTGGVGDGGGGSAMNNVDVSDHGEDVGGVQVTMSAEACDV